MRHIFLELKGQSVKLEFPNARNPDIRIFFPSDKIHVEAQNRRKWKDQ